MRLLVFGRTGQVATELARNLPSGVTADFLGRERADLADPGVCASIISATGADAVINAAAWTDVGRAEVEEHGATVVNAGAPAAMAQACAARGLSFLHISSDYVFPGAGTTAFLPGDPAAPLSAYGRSKLRGELAVRASGARHVILRTSWVFSAHGRNFVRTMLRLGSERQSLRVVADQVGGPTPAADLARALLVAAQALLDGHPGGTYHFAGEPDVSWAEFARAIMVMAELPCVIEEISSADYPTPARRPLSSRLDCSAFVAEFGIKQPPWKLGLMDVLKELGA